MKKQIIKLPKITDKELSILLYLYKFRFLNTNQFQKLFNHKKPQIVQKWLKDLKDKGFVSAHDFNDINHNGYIVHTKPTIYRLTKLARRKLKTNPKCEIEELDRIYQEKDVTDDFINRFVFIADVYLNLLNQLEGEEKLHFFTQSNLRGFEYMPNPLPNAYIAIKKPKKTKRYFLIYIDRRKPWLVQDKIINKYIEYVSNNDWSVYSNDPLPKFLIICPNDKRQKYFYELISNSQTNQSFYLATKASIQQAGFKGDWQKVE